MKDTIELALKTWYPKDHPLHSEMRHPAMKLAGEAGELLDLYGKHEYKPGFDWWYCKKCGNNRHTQIDDCLTYAPLVLDELGDFTYYFRIICYIAGIEMIPRKEPTFNSEWDIDNLLAVMAGNSCIILVEYLDYGNLVNEASFHIIWGCLTALFEKLNTTWEEVIELNYIKLNDSDYHGWKGA
jgi:hypothetical protein